MLLFDSALFHNLRHTERHVIILLKVARLSRIACLAFSKDCVTKLCVRRCHYRVNKATCDIVSILQRGCNLQLYAARLS